MRSSPMLADCQLNLSRALLRKRKKKTRERQLTCHQPTYELLMVRPAGTQDLILAGRYIGSGENPLGNKEIW